MTLIEAVRLTISARRGDQVLAVTSTWDDSLIFISPRSGHVPGLDVGQLTSAGIVAAGGSNAGLSDLADAVEWWALA